MLATLYSRAALGIEAPRITIEVHLARGLPAFNIVGLPEASVREARDRVRSALANSQFEFPSQRITVNLAPADLPKQGCHYDLAIALGILVASGQLPGEQLSQYELCAELSLSGELRPLSGVVPMALACAQQGRQLILPQASAEEAALLPEVQALGAEHLLQVAGHLLGDKPLVPARPKALTGAELPLPDLADVVGQPLAKRALLLAASGGHHLIMIGPPGSGKSMLASRLAGLLGPLHDSEALQVAAIHSACGYPLNAETWRRRPFRSPHHTSSANALIGGGSVPKPGEISLSHCGVLFLDELPEFERRALEALREPLEAGEITISRSSHKSTYPARFQLIAALNPCPCGMAGDPKGNCRCSELRIRRYLGKLSGPLLDRFDLQIEVPAVKHRQLVSGTARGESSVVLRKQVIQCQAKQHARQGKLNQALNSQELEQVASLDEQSKQFLLVTCDKLGLSARSFHKILRLGRTIADWDGKAQLSKQHLAEAIGYRSLERRIRQL